MKVNQTISDTINLRELAVIIVLIPLGWFLGLRFVMFHVVAAYLLVKIVIQKRNFSLKDSFSVEIYVLLAFIIIYCVSILSNLKNIPTSRLIGSLYNLSFWVMGLFLIFIFRMCLNKKNTDAVLTASSVFGLMTALFILVAYGYWFLSKGSYLAIFSPLYRILPQGLRDFALNKSPLIYHSLVPSVVGKDKLFGQPFPRSPGFNIYATALGLTMIILIGLTFAWYMRKNKDKKIIVILFLEGLTLLLSLSRMAILALILSVLLMVALYLIHRKIDRKIVVIGVLILIVVMAVFPYQKVVNLISSFRGGSTASRMGLYRVTISHAAERPILGHGFKPRTEEVPVPIGSHSTYLGIFFRTGIIGTASFLLFLFLVVRKWFRVRARVAGKPDLVALWYGSGIGLFGGLLWMITEDIDAPPVAAFFFFIVVALVLSLDRLAEEADSRTEKALSTGADDKEMTV